MREALGILLHLLRTEPWLGARFAAASAGRTLLTAGSILLIRKFLGGALGGGGPGGDPTGAIWWSALLLLAFYLGASALTYDSQVTQQKIVKALELSTMERVMYKLLSLSVSFHDRHTHGDLIQAVRQDVSQMRTSALAVARMSLESIQVIGLVAAALWLSPALTVLAFMVVPLATLPVAMIARRTLAQSFGVRRKGAELFDAILQLLRGIRVIKIYRGEKAEAERGTANARRYFDELIDMERTRALSRVVLETAGGLSLVAVIIGGGLSVMQGTMEWPALLAFLMAVRGAHGPLQNVNTSYVEVQRYGASVDRIQRLLAERPDVESAAGARRLEGGPERITLSGVGFSYGSGDTLADVSLEVTSGETLGIVGPSGSGKTTLLGLIARFQDPVRGTVEFDGINVRDIELSDVYDRIAIVTQDPFLFATTIRENVRCGRPQGTDRDVELACRAAGLHDDVMTMPDGYETFVGPGGRQLSRGEAQRVNIARAILKDAPILLLDEATSSLDAVSEARVQEAIESLIEGRGRITIIVAHRLSTLRGADRIVLLDGGRVRAIGTHDEVMSDSEVYRALVAAHGSFTRGGERS
ncbi:MAG: ABC transporter ATP-binding protein [Gemmatimonadota bacterium]